MRERTFLAAMGALDVLLILAGGALGFGYAGSDGVSGVVKLALLALVGGLVLYQLNVFVFDLAESGTSVRDSRLVAWAYVVCVLAGGVAAL